MEIAMPQLGETVTEGTITKWFKQIGDKVEEDEALFEVSTDKVDSEVPAVTSGVLTEILVPEGETAPVGAILAIVSDSAPAPVTEDGAVQAIIPDKVGAATVEVAAATVDAPPAVTHLIDAPMATVGAPAEPPSAAAPPAAPVTSPAAPIPADGNGSDEGSGRRLASPIVRHLMRQHNLDPTRVRGSGAGGRITRKDIFALTDRSTRPVADMPDIAEIPNIAKPAVAPTALEDLGDAQAATAPPNWISAGGTPRQTVLPFSNIRRRTAEHMVRSKATSPHAYASAEIDFEGVARLRDRDGVAFKKAEGFSLTYLPFVARAVVDAIAAFPQVNGSVAGEALQVSRQVGLAIAVDLSFEGLVTPVVQNADGKRLRQIARDIKDLADRARAKKLSATDMSRGTFTLTNTGSYGNFQTLPIINQPQVAILSTGGVRKRPVAVDDADGSDMIAVHRVGIITLGWDHRAFDGAYASAFLQHLQSIIETNHWEAELR